MGDKLVRSLRDYSIVSIYLQFLFYAVFFMPISHAESVFDYETPALPDGTFPLRFSHRAMGTEFAFDIYLREGDVGYDDIAPIAQGAFELVDSLEQQISSWIATSDTSLVNNFAAEAPVPVGKNTFDLMKFSAKVHAETEGVFDITVGPLIELWKTSLEKGTTPSEAELAAVLQRVDMNKVKLDTKKRSVSFARKGMRISFGGIGKGLALDQAAAYLKSQGIENAVLSGGRSTIVALGAPPGKDSWKIGIRNPYNDNDSVAFVYLRDQALSTSACYDELARIKDKPCGIYDPRTGHTVSELWSATVVGQSGMQTDALSTAFYILGVDGVRKYCATHPKVSAVLLPAPAAGETPNPIYIGKEKR